MVLKAAERKIYRDIEKHRKILKDVKNIETYQIKKKTKFL